MHPEEARRVLGVEPESEWTAIRAAHRIAIRRTHPDVGGSATSAARVNEPLDVRRRAADVAPSAPSPAPPTSSSPPPSARPSPVPPADVDRFFVVADDPRSLLARLAEAGHDVGEVVFVDPHVGMLEIVVGHPPNVGQLAVTVGVSDGHETTVSFTLDPLGIDAAPPIDGVVDALMAALEAG